MKKEKGITLIALVITIIILIILAGVSINLVLGENGIVSRAKYAKTTYEEESIKEKVILLLSEYKIEDNIITLDEFFLKLKNEGKIEEVESNGDGTHTIIFDGYAVTIKDNNLEIIEIVEETEFKKITRGKARFICNPTTGYSKKVEVSIQIDESIKIYTIQYKIENSTNWIDYIESTKFEVTSNGIISGRIVNPETNEIGYNFIININQIDDILPQDAIIKFNKTSIKVGETLQCEVELKDNETGINLANCKYIFNNSSNKIKEESAIWNTAELINSNPWNYETTLGSETEYYLHVLSTDMVGNKLETVSEKIEVTKNYLYKDGWNDERLGILKSGYQTSYEGGPITEGKEQSGIGRVNFDNNRIEIYSTPARRSSISNVCMV